jgi:hypothetical protein
LRLITHTHTTHLDEGSASSRDLYLTTYNYSQYTDIHTPAVFEPAMSASERPQSHTLDGAATRIGSLPFTDILIVVHGVW